MRLNYQNIVSQVLPYNGAISIIKKSGGNGYLLPLLFDWVNNYQFGGMGSLPVVGGGVRVDLTQADFSAGEDIPWRTIYIDNTQVPFDIELVFPDSGQTVTAKALSEKTARIYSSSNYFVVYFVYDNGSGYGLGNTTIQNMTFICFDTDDTSPSTDVLQLNRSTQSRALVIPALADQLITALVTSNSAPGTRSGLGTFPISPPQYNKQTIQSLIIRAIDISWLNQSASAGIGQMKLFLHQSPPNLDISQIGSWLGIALVSTTVQLVRLQDLHLEYPLTGTGTYLLQHENEATIVGNFNISIAYCLATYP